MIDGEKFKELTEEVNQIIDYNSVITSFTINTKTSTYDYSFLLDEINKDAENDEINDSYVLDIREFAEAEDDNEVEDVILENTPFTEIYIHDIPSLKHLLYKNFKTKYIFIDKDSLINIEELYIGFENITTDNVKQIISLIMDSCEMNRQMESDSSNLISIVVNDCGCHNLDTIHVHNTVNAFVLSCDCEEIDYTNFICFNREKVFSLLDPSCNIQGILFYKTPVSYGVSERYLDKSHLCNTQFTTKFFKHNFVKYALLDYIHNCLTQEQRFNVVNIMFESIIKPNPDFDKNILKNTYEQSISLLKILSESDINFYDVCNCDITYEMIEEKYKFLEQEIKNKILIDENDNINDNINDNNDIDDDDIIDIDFED